MPRGGKREGAGRPPRGAPKGNKNALGNKGGRPSSYKSEYAQIAKSMCELGATDFDLASAFDVVVSTVSLWKSTHIEFSDALKIGKAAADDKVERSLYQKAVGYSHDAVKIFANPRTGENVVVPFVEHYAPDTTAAIFWLKNRRKDVWRDRQEVEHSGMIETKDVSPRERIAGRIAGLAARSAKG